MIGKTLRQYEIIEPLGTGGMGEVYRARDTKLERDVAVKVLPAELADDPDRVSRLEREAKLLATLNHANIATIHDLDQVDGVRFLVLELIKGNSLEQLMTWQRLSVAEALDIAKQVAEALEAAHGQGIVHRDLKPANVLVTPEGNAKVLDFGIAKTVRTVTSGRETEIVTDLTMAGTLVGTAPYMSPEQVRGENVDKRADIWSFGCLLYEMLAGRSLFARETIADTMAAIIEVEPEWSRLPPGTPPPIKSLLARCLRKDPHRRLHDIADARIEIDEAFDAADELAEPADGVAGVPAGSSRHLLRAGVELAVVAALAASLWLAFGTADPVPRLAEPHASEMAMPDGVRLAFDRRQGQYAVVAVSPDGRVIAFTGTERERFFEENATTGLVTGGSLYLRRLDELHPWKVPDSEGAISPFFSPDGDWVAFAAIGDLRKVPIEGGSPVKLADGAGGGGAWAPGGRIVYTPAIPSHGLWTVSAEGGDAAPLTQLDIVAGEGEHRWPQVLPNGRSVLFTAWRGGSYDDSAIAIADIDSGEHRVVYEGGSMARYVPTGHLVFARAGDLWAIRFDLESERVSGTPALVVRGVLSEQTFHTPQFDVAAAGTLVYAPGGLGDADAELVWRDREGRTAPVTAEKRPYREAALSPTDDAVVFTTFGSSFSAFLLDMARGTVARLTPEGVYVRHATFGATGDSVLLTQMSAAVYDLWVKQRSADVVAERLFDSPTAYRGFASSSPSEALAFVQRDEGSQYLQVRVQESVGAEPRRLAAENIAQGRPDVSHDGRWLAYESVESGRGEVYAARVGGGRASVLVSTGNGEYPVWGRDGKELYYRDGSRLMVVAVDTSSEQLEAGVPQELFDDPLIEVWDAAADGRFLAVRRPEQPLSPTSLIVISNWLTELQRLVPTER